MAEEMYPLSSDNISKGKIIYIGFLFFLIFIMFFFTINVPDQAAKASIYISLGVFSVLAIIADLVLKRTGRVEFPDTVLWEEPLINVSNKTIAIIAIIMFIGTFFLISSQGSVYAISVPTFDVLTFGSLGNFALVTAAGVFENIFFFAVAGPLVGSFLFLLFGNKYLSLAGFFIVTPILFMLFHFAVYGPGASVAFISTLLFGFEQVVIVFLFRNMLISDARHVANNGAISLLRDFSPITLIALLLNNIIFWIILIIVSIALIQKARGKI